MSDHYYKEGVLPFAELLGVRNRRPSSSAQAKSEPLLTPDVERVRRIMSAGLDRNQSRLAYALAFQSTDSAETAIRIIQMCSPGR